MVYRVTGYACRFGVIDGGGDILQKNIFSKGIHGQVKMLYQHDMTRPIGIWRVIIPDDYGLYVEGDIYQDIQDGAYAAKLVDHHIINGLSIGYHTLESYYRHDNVRIIETIDLKEISLVTFPMQSSAHIL